MTWKIWCVLLVMMLAAGIGGFAACGSGDDDDDSESESPSGDDDADDDDDSDGDIEQIYAYIQGSPYSRLVIELDYVGGKAPSEDVIATIESTYADLLDKPGGVEVVLDEELDARGDDYAWSQEERNDLADATFDLAVPDDTIKMHAVFVDGHSARDGGGIRILGVAFHDVHFFIYQDTIDSGCDGMVSGLLGGGEACELATATISMHEMGHLIGLVDNGLPMVEDHKDPDTEHGDHSANKNSIMYWAYDTNAGLDQLVTRITGGKTDPPPFDENDRQDIDAAKE
ncbi:hypothetical protein KDL45_12045 [bacterium]|nr:hypothetical protein [bacterium]